MKGPGRDERLFMVNASPHLPRGGRSSLPVRQAQKGCIGTAGAIEPSRD